MKLIHKYVHLIGKKVEYNGDIIKKDMIIKINDIKERKKFISLAKVNKCRLIKNESTKECLIELLYSK